MKKTAYPLTVETVGDGEIKIEQDDNTGNDPAIIMVHMDQVDLLIEWLQAAKKEASIV